MDRLTQPRDLTIERPRHRFTRSQYDRLVDIGFFDRARVELIDGEIVEMSPQKSPHRTSVLLVVEELRRMFARGAFVQSQAPLALRDNDEPEPDAAVIAGAIKDYRGGHPTTARLVVEVADTTLAYDRSVKSRVYASNGLLEYWIVNLVDRLLEVHRQPVRGRSARYATITLHKPNARVSPLAAPKQSVLVADLLP